jgi:hypothetical protein
MATPQTQQTAEQISNTPTVPREYSLESRFKTPTRSNPRTVYHLQSFTLPLHVQLACDEHILRSLPDEYVIEFWAATDPQCPRFEIRLYLEPKPAQGQQRKSKGLFVTFMAYDETEPTEKLPPRTPYKWQDQLAQTPPSGPLSFSRQLKNVRLRTISDAEREAGFVLPRVDDRKYTDEHHRVFSWQSEHFIELRHTVDTSTISPAKVQAVETLKSIETSLKAGSTLYVTFAERHSTSSDRFLDQYWPRFAALPSPSPPDYWAWLNSPAVIRQTELASNDRFELDREYVECALSDRVDTASGGQKNWFTPDKNFDVTKKPSPMSFCPLPRCDAFLTERHYLFYVMGNFAFENAVSKLQPEALLNGSYNCRFEPAGEDFVT